MTEWDSKRMIDGALDSFECWLEKTSNSPGLQTLWVAYYTGWLEGRYDMLRQIEEESEVRE